MTHYVCTGGCGGVSEDPGTCNNKSCMKYHNFLSVCHCTDGRHAEALEHPNVATDSKDQEQV